MSSIKISGTVAPGFEPVREQFEAHFLADKERNAQCCVYVGKEKVVVVVGKRNRFLAERPKPK